LSLIRFTTIEKYRNQDAIAGRSSGLTGPLVPDAKKAEQLRDKNIAAAKIRIKAELRSETKGILLTVIGTLIWAYGAYVPIFWCALHQASESLRGMATTEAHQAIADLDLDVLAAVAAAREAS
jgi:hypothetical protein